MIEDTSATLITALQKPAAYPHPVSAVRLVETHISWVLLTGAYAYKIKKPVQFGFLDFSTLALRRHCCEEELRLNRRLAPELYLAVMPIRGPATRPVLCGRDDALEFAVKMREFPQDDQFDRLLMRGLLEHAHISALAARLAAFHRDAAVAALCTPYGSAEAVWQPMTENFAHIRPHLHERGQLDALAHLQRWSEQRYGQLHALLVRRKQEGFVRECHGDVHLGNIVLLDGAPVVFDCIEFNPNLRWIDVMSELAFLTMDLHDRGQPGLAYRALNDYLQASGDYDGLALLRFYQVYRALVRAKVAYLRLAQEGIAAQERSALAEHAAGYLRLATRFTTGGPISLMITHGLSGSGKTTVTDEVLETQGAVRLRSDVERKRLFGLSAEARSGAGIADGIYSSAASARTYQHLAALAESILAASLPVLVDAAFLQRAQRELFRDLAARLNVPFVIFDCSAPADQLRTRITERANAARDASEATLAVLDRQLRQREPVGADEALHIFTIHTGSAPQ